MGFGLRHRPVHQRPSHLVYDFASFISTFTTFSLIWLINGYLQSFGAPGMIKMNVAWFRHTERGTFAGIFGFMIQLGQFAINNLAPIILAGFTVGMLVVAQGDWRWLFRIPPLITAAVAILLAIFVKQTPEEAGYPNVIEHAGESAGAQVPTSLRESFVTIFTHPLVWFYAIAYACTGAVRNSSDQLAILYFVEQLKLNLEAKPPAVFWTMNLTPLVAVLGSFSAGIISDRVFKGHRSPVAMGLYFLETIVILAAAAVIMAGRGGRRQPGFFSVASFSCLSRSPQIPLARSSARPRQWTSSDEKWRGSPPA